MNEDDFQFMLLLMEKSESQSMRLYARRTKKHLRKFFKFVSLSPDIYSTLFAVNNKTAEEDCQEIFRYGWLNPDGEFITVCMAEHENTVKVVTGYEKCDLACEAGWVKFTIGVPYNHLGESLFEPDSDRRLLSRKQVDWLNNSE